MVASATMYVSQATHLYQSFADISINQTHSLGSNTNKHKASTTWYDSNSYWILRQPVCETN